jgi:hypothetical protein
MKPIRRRAGHFAATGPIVTVLTNRPRPCQPIPCFSIAEFISWKRWPGAPWPSSRQAVPEPVLSLWRLCVKSPVV